MNQQGKHLARFSIGVGDRFAHQAAAQLAACRQALMQGVEVIPVWNKSNREHTIIGSEPASVRQAADAAVKKLRWDLPYYCDADHINAGTVPRFLADCDFFTLDVADYIGQPASQGAVDEFIHLHRGLIGAVHLDGIESPIQITPGLIRATAAKYLVAVQHAAEVYRMVESAKGSGGFITEVSMDETDAPQSPAEFLLILAALADAKVPLQTIAPKFSGRFNKGVDYVGDVARFAREFEQDIAAIAYAVRHFGLPANLKLSIHSGSDKFSIYPSIHAALNRFGAGVHLKTAGTTWIEEVIGLAECGGDGLALAKEIYAEAHEHREELAKPYATVIDIDVDLLPEPSVVNRWGAEQFTVALRHDPHSPGFNPSLRQLVHVGFKEAARMGVRYTRQLEENEDVIARNVTGNLFTRHIAPVFLGGK